jgi:hypothetical protein
MGLNDTPLGGQDIELPPGTAAQALESARGTLAGVSSLEELVELYRTRGIHLHLGGTGPGETSFFASVLEAIQGFTAALDWLPLEMGRLPPPRADWPSGVWLEVGSFDAPNAPARRDFARTLVESSWRGIWFQPDSRLLLDGSYVSDNPFEGTVHELGHLTMVRSGAIESIREAAAVSFSRSNPGDHVSFYARTSFADFWGEATAAVNTGAWKRPIAIDRPRLRRFVAEVNGRSDVPLI